MPKILIKRSQGTAQQFIEPLGNQAQLEMVKIPGGTFTMGSPKSEEGSQDNERPQHQVTVAGFFMGKYPITQAQWRAVANLPEIERELKPDPSRFKGDNRPVEQVTWFDAVEFCRRLSQHTNRNYRLPSEAEWEYACRAGTTTPFHFGETITPELANYNAEYSYGDAPKGEYREETTVVGSFAVANGFGLYDMHGNVWEWCADSWHDSYDNAPNDGRVWHEGGDNNLRVMRGGSWFNVPRFCRSALRYKGEISLRDVFIGFRVVSDAV